MKSVFISRPIQPSSPIRKIIGNNLLVAKSLIKFSALEFETPQADWIFFYSRNGVKYFFENGNYELYPYLWACLSTGTADELRNYITDDISFIGNGSPEQIANSYKTLVNAEQITCFVRAENSLDSIHKRIDHPNNFSIPVYSNSPIKDTPKQKFDILIFTSPMSADAWFKNNEYNNEKVISIGPTTADHLLNKYGVKNIIIAESPSELSIANCLISLL